MAFTTSDNCIKSLPKAAREIWVDIANKCMTGREDSEDARVSAVRIAWSAVEKAGYKKGEGVDSHKWVGGSTLMKSFQPFQVPLAILKAETRDGAPYLILRASGPKVDRQGERMSDGALKGMIAKAKAGGVEMLENHYASFPMAKSDDAWMDDANGELLFGMKANVKHPFIPMLMDDIQKGEHNYHTSVGGAVLDAAWEYDKDLGKTVRVLKEVDIDHVAVTRAEKSAYPFDEKTSFVGAILKQMLPASMPGKAGECMNEILELMKKAAEVSEQLRKSLQASVTEDMFEKSETGAMVLKKEHVGLLTPSVSMTPEQKVEFEKSLEAICKAVGAPLKKEATLPPKAEGEETDEEKAKKSAQGDAATPAATAGGPGSGAPHDGNGSAAAKAVTDTLMKNLAEDLKKATEAMDALKKDHSATKEDLLKKAVEMSEMRTQLSALQKSPVNPRPMVGQEQPIAKTEGSVAPRPSDNLEKGGEGNDALTFVKGIEAASDALLKQKSARPWTPEETAKATYYGSVLKTARSVGPSAAFEQYGKKS